MPKHFFEKFVPKGEDLDHLTQRLKKYILPEEKQSVERLEAESAIKRANFLQEMYKETWKKGGSIIERLYEKERGGEDALEFDVRSILRDFMKRGKDKLEYFVPDGLLTHILEILVTLPEFDDTLHHFDATVVGKEILHHPRLIQLVLDEHADDKEFFDTITTHITTSLRKWLSL